jgi:hypothetical protein
LRLRAPGRKSAGRICFYLTDFGNQRHAARQQIQQRLIHFINLIA